MTAAASSSTMAGARAAVYVDRALTSPVREYSALPPDAHQWSKVHRYHPCVFRKSDYLWDVHQQRQLRWLFRSGWKDDPGHVLLTLSGIMRPCVAAPALPAGDSACSTDSYDSEAEEVDSEPEQDIAEPSHMPIHLGVALHGRMKFGRYLLSDCSLTSVDQVAACAYLLHGPPLFRPLNLATATPDSSPTHDHWALRISVGTAGSFVTAHTESYGADSYSYLVEGRRLWFMARPEHEAEFTALFADSVPSTTGVRLAQRLLAMGAHAVLQEPTDTVYVPGGWIYAVHNVSFSAWVSGNFIRPWHLGHTLRWARRVGRSESETFFNLPGIMQTVNEGEWELSRAEVESLQREWKAVQEAWNREGSAPASLSP